MKLLAIPNDPTTAYSRSNPDEFLGEFNPLFVNKRFFQEVRFLNWRDKEEIEYGGIKSIPFLEDKVEAERIMNSLRTGESEYRSPLFQDLFEKNLEEVQDKVIEFNPSLIRAFNTYFASELGSIFSKRLRIPLVVSAHDVTRITESIKDANYLICISNAVADICINKYGFDRDRIKIIPDGVDMNLFRPSKNSLNNAYPGRYKVLSVGRLVPGKNIERLLESIKLADDELREICHIHLGEGYLRKDILIMRNELGLEGKSHFLGAVNKDKLPLFYNWADVHVLPTLHEGLGRVSIESLACGTPVITTNYAPMTEIVQDEVNGLLVNPNSSKDIAEKIIRILTKKEIYSKLSSNARGSVVEKYDIKRVMEMNASFYNEILKL